MLAKEFQENSRIAALEKKLKFIEEKIDKIAN